MIEQTHLDSSNSYLWFSAISVRRIIRMLAKVFYCQLVRWVACSRGNWTKYNGWSRRLHGLIFFAWPECTYDFSRFLELRYLNGSMINYSDDRDHTGKHCYMSRLLGIGSPASVEERSKSNKGRTALSDLAENGFQCPFRRTGSKSSRVGGVQL